MISIIEHNLEPGIHLTSHNSENSGLGKAILEFVQWFANNDFGRRLVSFLSFENYFYC